MAENSRINDKRIHSLRQQDEEYNALFRKWRSDRANKFGYYLSGSSENTYKEGEGFAGQYPAADERESLGQSISLLTQVLLLYTLCEAISKFLFSDFPSNAPLGITLAREGYAAVADFPHIFASYVSNILTRLIPVTYLLIRLRIPLQIVVPLKITNKPLFRSSVPIAMLTFGIMYVCSTLSEYVRPSVAHRPVYFTNGGLTREEFPMVILYCLVIPVISEIIHRGVFLQIFRQYGDGYALLLTSMIAAFTSIEDESLMIFFYSLMIGYSTLRTGSVITAIVMRVIISGGYFCISSLSFGASERMRDLIISISVLFIIGFGIVSLIRFISTYSNRISLPLYSLYVSDFEKLMLVFANPGFIIWVVFYLGSILWSVTFAA